MTCPNTSTLGVYLLGALEPEERSTFESHLYGCDICRAELVRLAPLPGLLNQIAITDFEETAEPEAAPTSEPATSELATPEPMTLEPLTPEPVALEPVTAEPATPEAGPDVPEPKVLDLPVEPEEPTELAPSRRRRWLVAAVAAGVIALSVGGLLAYQAIQSDPPPHTVTWSAVDPNSGVNAKVQLTERSWGTDIKVWMSNVSESKACRLVVKAKYGYLDKPDAYVEVAGWWTSNHNPNDDIPGSTSIDLASIYKLEIMDGDRMLVGIPQASG